MPFYYSDSTMLILIPALLFALYAQQKVRSAYRNYARVASSRGYTGRAAARAILDRCGLYHVLVEEGSGTLTDHYDPRRKVVRLSSEVFHGASISAVGIAAHECGHAIQHDEQYAPLTLRSAIVPVTNIGSRLAVPILLVGFLLNSQILILLGILGYSLMALFQLVTLPVEFNASSRALAIIQETYLLEDSELTGAKKVLSAAAMTYVAALISASAQLLRLILLANRRRR